MAVIDPTKTRLSEQWAAAFGFPSYEVSTHGRVRRATTKLYQKAGRVLNGTVNMHGYRQHSLYDVHGKCKTVLTSRVVLSTFTQDPGEGKQARHLNGYCLDNSLDNLQWGTQLENEEDKVRHGTHAKGTSHGMSKVGEAEVREIRRRGVRENAVALGKVFNLSQTQVLDILNYKSWRHI